MQVTAQRMSDDGTIRSVAPTQRFLPSVVLSGRNTNSHSYLRDFIAKIVIKIAIWRIPCLVNDFPKPTSVET